MSLGSYSNIAQAYNATSTIHYQLPNEITKSGNVKVIDQPNLFVSMDINEKDEVESILFNVQNANDPFYPGTFQGFEFGMGWSGQPSYISSFIEAKQNVGQEFVSKGIVEYRAKVFEDNHLEVQLISK